MRTNNNKEICYKKIEKNFNKIKFKIDELAKDINSLVASENFANSDINELNKIIKDYLDKRTKIDFYAALFNKIKEKSHKFLFAFVRPSGYKNRKFGIVLDSVEITFF